MGETTTPVIRGAGGDQNREEQLRAKIAETRNDMSNTIEELHGRLNPAVFKEQAIEQFHEAADTVKAELKAHFADAKELIKKELIEAKAVIKREVATEIDSVKTRVTDELAQAKTAMRDATIGKVETMVHDAKDKVQNARTSVMETVRENPIPAAMIGVGLAWLLFGRRKPRHAAYAIQGHDAQPAEPREGNVATRSVHAIQDAAGAGAHQVNELAHQAGRKISDVTSTAASAANRAVHEAGSAIVSTASRVQHAGADLGHGAATQARKIRSQGSELFQANPLAVGAAVIAVGAAVALALPHTRIEDDLMGEARDQLADRVQDVAHDAIGRAGDAAEHVRDNLAETAGSRMQKSPGLH